jgi:hypothetical protein
MAGKYHVKLSRSQQMALIDLISSTLRCRCDSRLEQFVDCSTSPTTVTTPGELLRLVSGAKHKPDPPDLDAPLNTKVRPF